jgi:hypothetical protein
MSFEYRDCSSTAAAACFFAARTARATASKCSIVIAFSNSGGGVWILAAGRSISNNRCNAPVYPNRWQCTSFIHASPMPLAGAIFFLHSRGLLQSYIAL